MQFWRKEMFKVNAKEYLSQAYYIDQSIDCKMEQIKSLREFATTIANSTPVKEVFHGAQFSKYRAQIE